MMNLEKLKTYLPYCLGLVYFFFIISPTNFLCADNPLRWECPLVAPTPNPIDTTKPTEDQIVQIDKEISDLQDMKEKFKAKAARYQDLGDRLQFYDNYVTEARRYWDLSDCALEIADKIDIEIALLKQQKLKLQESLPKKP
jgi:hypothetical protein